MARKYQRVRVSTYTRNVGKSFGYAVRDVVGDYIPVTRSVVKSTKSAYDEIKTSMRNMKNNNISDSTRGFKKKEGNILTNTLADLKSGNWYNQERKDKADAEMFGFGDDDFGFDFGDDDDDWGDFDDGSSDNSDIIEHDEMNTRQIMSSMSQVGSEVSRSVGYASAQSAEYIVANNNASSRALYDLGAHGFNQVSTILLNMDNSIGALVQLGEPLAAHLQNSSVFYTNTTESLNKISTEVEKMTGNLQTLVDRTEYLDKKTKQRSSYDSEFSLGEGSYLDFVKANAKEQLDSVKGILDMVEMMYGKNGKNTSLAEMGLKAGISAIIPQVTKDVAKQFDESLSMYFNNALMRGGKKLRSGGFLSNIIADIFTPKEKIKKSFDTSKYEKGPMQWNGIANQSLTYVIPTYLAQMTSLLAGVNDEADYMYYDFKSGRFTTKRLFRKKVEAVDRRKAASVGGEFRDLALASTGNEKQKKEIEEYFYQAYLNGGDFYNIKKGKNDADWRKKYGNISPETVELLLQVIQESNAAGPNKYRNVASQFEYNNNNAIKERTRNLNEEEALGYSFYTRTMGDDGTTDFRYVSQVGNGGGNRKGERNRSVSGYTKSFDETVNNMSRTNNSWRENGDHTYTVGANNVVLEEQEFNKWLDAYNNGDKATMRKIENSQAAKEAKKKAQGMAGSIGQKLRNAAEGNKPAETILNILDKGKDIIQTPMYAVSMAMDTLQRGLNNLFWGDESNEGIIDKLKNKINDIWEKITDKLGGLTQNGRRKKVIRANGLPEGTEDIIPDEREAGAVYLCLDAEGKVIGTCDAAAASQWYEANRKRDSFKESMQKTWGEIKGGVKNFFTGGDNTSSLKEQFDQFKNSSGFDGSGSGLKISGGDSGQGEYRRIGKSNIYTDGKNHFFTPNENGGWDPVDTTTAEGMKTVAGGFKDAISKSSPVEGLKSSAATLVGGLGKFFAGVTGKETNPDKEAAKQEKQRLFDTIQQAFKDAGDNKGALGFGAIAGAGVSVLTGAVVGPLAGAAIGAGVGLAVKSQAFQDFLFGKGDPESDDYQRGLLGSLGEKLRDKDNQTILKSAGIGGGAGLVAGTLMGSPILGMVAGSTIGYVAKSQKAQEFLFGTEDKKSALGILKDKATEAAPNIGAGMIAGALVGPFGIAGNLLVGAGMGYLSSTDKFQKYMFGDPDDPKDKGLAGAIHDKIMNPLDEIIHNMINKINGFGRRMGIRITKAITSIGNFIKDKASDFAKKYENTIIGKLGKKLVGAPGKLLKGAVGAVGGVLDAADTRLKKGNLKRGDSVYSAELGRNQTAEERMNTRMILKNGGYTQDPQTGLYYKVNANGKSKEISKEAYEKGIAKNATGARFGEDSNFDKMDQAIMKLSEEDINNLTGKDAARKSKAKLMEILGVDDVSKVKDTDVAQFINLLKDEKKGKYSDAAKEGRQKQQEVNMVSVINDELPKATSILDKIKNLLSNLGSAITGKPINENKDESENSNKPNNKDSKDSDNKEGFGGKIKDMVSHEDEEEEQPEPDNDAGSGTYKAILRKMAGGSSEDRRTEFTNNGPMQYVKNSQGEWIVDRADKETQETQKKQNIFNKSISEIGKFSGILGGISGALGFIKEGLLGDGDKKEGILSKLFSGLFGEEGALSGILSLFTGKTGGIKNIVKNIAASGGANIIKTLLTDVGIGALVYMGFQGAFDGIASSITSIIGGKGAGDAYGSQSIADTRTYEVTTSDGSTLTAAKDENGNFVDANGNIMDVVSVNGSNQNNVASFSDKLKENTARGVLTGTSSVASKALSKTTAGKAVSKVASSFTDAAMLASLQDDVLNGVIKFTSVLKKVPALSALADSLDNMGLELAEKIGTALSSQTAKNITNLAASAVVWAKVAFIVVDFTTGYEDARTTLGIVTEPTVGQRILAGLLRAIKNFIPVVGTLIPDSLVIDVFCNYIAPALGIDVEELKNAREESQETVDNYNKTTGKNLSIAEFNKSVLKDYTWTERVGNAASTTVEDAKAKMSNFTSSVKENGLVDTFKNMGADAINTFKDSYSENGGGIAGIVSGIGDTFGNMLPGVLGEVVQKNMQIKSLALKGQIKDMWGVSLDDFSGGGEQVEGTDLTTAVPSIFSKIVGQIPLIVSKVTMTPISLVAMAGRKIGEFASGVVDKLRGNINTIQQSFSTGAEMLTRGGDFSFSEFMDTSSITEDDDNPVGGITAAICKISRFVSLPAMLLKTAGNKIATALEPIKEKITNTASNIVTNYTTIQDSAKAGDIAGVWSNEIEDDEGNPLGGLYKGINFVQKLQSTPLALFKMVGNKVIEFLHIDDIKSDATTFSSTIDKMKDYSSTGDIGSIWNTTATFSDDDPVKAFFNIGLTINKIIHSIVGVLNKIMGPIQSIVGTVSDTVGGIVDGVTGTVGNVVDGVTGAVDNVKNTVSNVASNAWNTVTGWVSGGSSGFVNQFDPKYQHYSVSGQQFGAKGCGPAVASMAASAFGKNLSVGDAVRAANGYETSNGVTLDYFQSALGSKGINTEVIAGGSSADMYSKLARGEKVILLGQDSNNTSKAYSPFGPNNHYVLATGLDRSGNVIVNDPESKGPRSYNPAILASAKYGIAGSSSGLFNNRKSRRFRNIAGAGGPTRNDAITQQVWAYLTTKLGMSEAAAAGVMGNMEQESGCQPNMQQKGGTAFGICQWDGGRKSNLMKRANYQNLDVQLDFMAEELPSQYWKKSGTITDSNGKNYSYQSMTYEQFKQLTDVATATVKFEAAFERAGKPNLQKRIQFAKEYYEMFTGKTYTIDPTIGTSDYSAATGVSSTGSTSSSGNSIFNIISTITSAFSNAFSGKSDDATNAAATYGNADSNVGTTAGTTYNPVSPSFTSNSPVAWMKSILGKISYSMSGPRDPEKGSADCSSTVRWAIKKAGGPDIGSSTVAQLDSSSLSPVWDGNGSYATSSVESAMKPNDVIFFSRPNSSFSAGRKYRVGHVGLYEGNGKYIDHGSGMGPKEKDLKFGTDGKIVRVSRIKNAGANSGIYSYDDLALAAGGSSGLLMSSRAGSNKPGVVAMRDSRTGRLVPVRVAGGDSDIASMTTSMLNTVRTNVSNQSKSGTVSEELVAQLLQSITNILNSIADNTAPVAKIYNALTAYISAGAGTKSMDTVKVNKTPKTQNASNGSQDVDSNIRALAGVLAELAKG